MRWRPVRDLRLQCEVACDDAELARALQTLFAPWIVTTSAEANAPDESGDIETLRWNVRRDADGWTLRACDARPDENAWGEDEQGRALGEGDALRTEKFNHALASLEYSALRLALTRIAPAFWGVHGALLRKNERTILVVGPSQSGKSTLSCALWNAGWQLQSDDFSVVNRAGEVQTAPRRVSLRLASRALLGEALWNRVANAPSSARSAKGLVFHPHEIEVSAPSFAEAVAPDAIIFLARRNANVGASQISPLSSAAATMSLLPYSTLASSRNADGEHRVLDIGSALTRVALLCGRAPAFDLGRGALDEMVSQVERCAGFSP